MGIAGRHSMGPSYAGLQANADPQRFRLPSLVHLLLLLTLISKSNVGQTHPHYRSPPLLPRSIRKPGPNLH